MNSRSGSGRCRLPGTIQSPLRLKARPGSSSRLHQEIEILLSLKHERVVKLVDVAGGPSVPAFPYQLRAGTCCSIPYCSPYRLTQSYG